MIIHVPFVFNQKSCHSEDIFFTIHFPIWAYVKTFSSGSGHL